MKDHYEGTIFYCVDPTVPGSRVSGRTFSGTFDELKEELRNLYDEMGGGVLAEKRGLYARWSPTRGVYWSTMWPDFPAEHERSESFVSGDDY